MFLKEGSGVSLDVGETSVREDSISDDTEKHIEDEHATKSSDTGPLTLIERATEFMNNIVAGVAEDANDGHSLAPRTSC